MVPFERRPAVLRLNDKLAGLLPAHARESGVVFAGDVFSKFLTFLITVLLLKLVGPAEYALYGIFITILTAALQFTDSGLHQSLIKFVAMYQARNPARAEAHLKLTWRVKLFTIGITATVLLLGASFMAERIFLMPDLALPIRLIGLGVVGGGIFEFVQAALQARQKFGLLTLFRISEGLGKLLFILIFVSIGAFALEAVYWAYAAVPMLLAVAGAILLRNKGLTKGPVDWKDTGSEIMGFGKWVMLASFSTMFLMRIDLFMLPPMLPGSPEDIGHYAAAVRLCTPLIVIVNSVVTVFFPKAMALDTRAEMRGYIKRSMQVTLPLIAMSTIYGAGVVLIVPVYFPDYAPSVPLFAVLFIGYAWTLFGNPLTTLVLSINRAKTVAAISFAQLIATIISHYFFISEYGVMGAAVSTVIVWFAAGSFSLGYLHRHRNEIEQRETSGEAG